jgi:PAS domain S-box-containing protein
VIGIAGLLLGPRGAVTATVLSLMAGASMLLAEASGRPFGPAPTSALVFAITVALFPVLATLQFLGVRSLRRALEKARISDSQHRLLIDESPEGIVVSDADGRLELANPAACRMLGCGPGEIGSRDVRSLFEEDPGGPGPAGAGDADVEWHERHLVGPRGDPLPILAATKRMPGGRRLHLIQDLSARRKAEEERERLQRELAHAQRVESVGRLAGGIAHDFNNILTSILGNVSFALQDLEPGHPLREPLDDAAQAARSAANLTQQLLAFSRRQMVNPRVVAVNEVVARVEKMLRRLIGEDVVLQTLLHPDAGHVRIDPGQLEQVLVNLSVNARQAMPAGGRLLIETASVALDAEAATRRLDVPPADYVVLRVADTGKGMSGEEQQRLFEPFFTTKEMGTGLGLATVHGIVKQNGGAITVASEEGRGSTFEVLLPRVRAPVEPAAEEAPASPGRGGSETILLVEDDPLVRGMAVKALRRQGYSVVPCASGVEALAALVDRADGIALVVTDVVMPDMNGRELAERLAVSHPGLKVLFASGYAEEAVAGDWIQRARIQFIAKPYTPEGLAAKVREVLDG